MSFDEECRPVARVYCTCSMSSYKVYVRYLISWWASCWLGVAVSWIALDTRLQLIPCYLHQSVKWTVSRLSCAIQKN